MFLVSDTLEERSAKIHRFIAEREPAIAVLLAAVDCERTIRRAVMSLGTTPTMAPLTPSTTIGTGSTTSIFRSRTPSGRMWEISTGWIFPLSPPPTDGGDGRPPSIIGTTMQWSGILMLPANQLGTGRSCTTRASYPLISRYRWTWRL